MPESYQFFDPKRSPKYPYPFFRFTLPGARVICLWPCLLLWSGPPSAKLTKLELQPAPQLANFLLHGAKQKKTETQNPSKTQTLVLDWNGW